MKHSLFYLPSIGSRAELEAGCAGLRPELYQRMLGELSYEGKYWRVPPGPTPWDLETTRRLGAGVSGITAVLPPLHPVLEGRLFELYAEVAGQPLGEGIGVLRDVVIAESDEEAQALWVDSGIYCGAAWFAPFGFDRGLAHPDTGERPDLLGEGLALVGTVDSVTRQLEALLERLPARWLFHWTYNGLIPHAKLMRSIEAFATRVMPRFSHE